MGVERALPKPKDLFWVKMKHGLRQSLTPTETEVWMKIRGFMDERIQPKGDTEAEIAREIFYTYMAMEPGARPRFTRTLCQSIYNNVLRTLKLDKLSEKVREVAKSSKRDVTAFPPVSVSHLPSDIEIADEITKTFPEQLLGYRPRFAEPGNFFQWQLDVLNKYFRNPNCSEKRVLIEAQRGAGKTTMVALYTAYRILVDRGIRVGYFSETVELAQEVVNLIHSILSHPAFIEKFGDIILGGKTAGAGPDKRKYKRTISQFTVARETSDKEPTIRAMGVGTSVVGKRFDLAIFDDIISMNSAQSEKEMETLARLFVDIEGALTPRADKIYIGTPKRKGDYYDQLAASGNVSVYRVPAMSEFPPFKVETETLGDGRIMRRYIPDFMPVINVPENWDYESLMLRRQEMGERAFMQEYMLQYITFYSPLLPVSELQVFETIDDVPAGASWVSVVDPTISKEANRKGDFFVIAIVGKFKDQFYVPYLSKSKAGMPDQINAIIEHARDFEYLTYIEYTRFQEEVYRKVKESVPKKVVKFSPKGEKVSRITDTLSPLFLDHRLHVHKDVAPILEDELNAFVGDGKSHDDAIDAITSAINILKTGSAKIVRPGRSFI